MGKKRSGQMLIVAALMIATIIVSTMVYVYKTTQFPLPAESTYKAKAFVRNTKLGTRNLVIGSLANISYGGESQILETNLERWCDFVESQYYYGKCDLSFDLCETSPYSSGIWISWGEEGVGVTSAKTDFSFNLTNKGADLTVTFPINVTASVSITGTYMANPAFWQDVNTTIHLRNEGEPALTGNLTIYYQHTSGWRDAGDLSNYSLEDFGNGTYSASFTLSRFWTHRISVKCYDGRDILVRANVTSDQIVVDPPVFLVGTLEPELSKFDNETWTSVAPPGGGRVQSIGSNVEYWLIGDSDRKVWKYDGQSFTDVSPTTNPFQNTIVAIGWGDGYWLVGDQGGRIQKYDGSSWTDLTDDAGFLRGDSPLGEIEWNEDFGYWLVGGKRVVKKFDGTTWTDVSPTSRQFSKTIEAIGCDGSVWLVGDQRGIIQKFDGTSWTDLTSDAGFYSANASIYAIDWGDGKFLVGGKSGIVKTYDGSSWSDESSGWGSTNDVYAIEYSDTYRYWLVGGEGGIIKSFDGSSWTDRTDDAGLANDVTAISAEFQC